MERFGAVESKSKRNAPAKPNRRQREVAQKRRELRILRKQYREANTGEKEGLQQLRETLRSRLKFLQNAKSSRKRRTKAKKRAAFVQISSQKQRYKVKRKVHWELRRRNKRALEAEPFRPPKRRAIGRVLKGTTSRTICSTTREQ